MENFDSGSVSVDRPGPEKSAGSLASPATRAARDVDFDHLGFLYSIHFFKPVQNSAFGIGTREVLHLFYPVTLFEMFPLVEDGKDRHHTLKGPDADETVVWDG